VTRLCSWLLAFALSAFVPGLAQAQIDSYSPTGADDAAAAKELAMPDGPDDVVFLRAIPDKQKAVIGEQVTVSIYLYYRVAYEMSERNDASYTGFLRYSLLTDPGSTSPVYTQVKGQRYGARLVERVALIPLRSGKLNTGSMTARFKGRQIGARVLKASNEVVIEVEEPPTQGRPTGYVLGDVGQFTVTANVKPRATKQGGSVGVVVRIEGVGNPPSKLAEPPIPGGKWLDPRTRDTISGKSGKVAGARFFEYVVRFGNAGETQLGKLEVPYYDPVTKSYVVAEVDLGKVDVEEAAVTETEVDRARTKDDPNADPLKALPPARTTLTGFTPERHTSMPLSWFALGLFLPPALALFLLGAGRARTAVKERQTTAGAALKQKLKEAQSDAQKADKAADARALSGAIERMIHASIELETGVKSRALRMDELAQLKDAGLDASTVDEIKAVLAECDTLRFAPSVDDEARTGLLSRAKALTKKLGA
jgi:hypothetical protein